GFSGEEDLYVVSSVGEGERVGQGGGAARGVIRSPPASHQDLQLFRGRLGRSLGLAGRSCQGPDCECASSQLAGFLEKPPAIFFHAAPPKAPSGSMAGIIGGALNRREGWFPRSLDRAAGPPRQTSILEPLPIGRGPQQNVVVTDDVTSIEYRTS